MNKYITESKAKQVLTEQRIQNAAHSEPVGAMPTHKDIAMRAYEIYVEKGGRQGHREQDWLQAEQELKNQQHWQQAESK